MEAKCQLQYDRRKQRKAAKRQAESEKEREDRFQDAQAKAAERQPLYGKRDRKLMPKQQRDWDKFDRKQKDAQSKKR